MWIRFPLPAPMFFLTSVFPPVVLYTTDIKEGGGSRSVQFTHREPICGYGVIAAAADLKSVGRKTVRVQVPLPAQF